MLFMVECGLAIKNPNKTKTSNDDVQNISDEGAALVSAGGQFQRAVKITQTKCLRKSCRRKQR